MPKADLENYRIMKALPLMVNRLGLKMVHELNSEHLTRIFENALQVSHFSFESFLVRHSTITTISFIDENCLWIKIFFDDKRLSAVSSCSLECH